MRHVCLTVCMIMLFPGICLCQSQDKVTLTTYLPKAEGLYHRIETERISLGRSGVGYLQFNALTPAAGILGYNNSRFETSDRFIFRHMDARDSEDENTVILGCEDIYLGDPANFDQTALYINEPFRLRSGFSYLHLKRWSTDSYARLYVDAPGSGLCRLRIQPRNDATGPTGVLFDCDVPGGESAFAVINGSPIAMGSTKFWVNGDGTVYTVGSGNVHDIAEYVACAKGLEEADVAVIGDKGLLEKSSRKKDSRVAGVISTSPTIIMGQDTGGRKLLALSGIVPCRAEALEEEIRPGDLLCTSSVKGHARRAVDPVPGTVIGRALKGLKRGEKGVIEVMVGLE